MWQFLRYDFFWSLDFSFSHLKIFLNHIPVKEFHKNSRPTLFVTKSWTPEKPFSLSNKNVGWIHDMLPCRKFSWVRRAPKGAPSSGDVLSQQLGLISFEGNSAAGGDRRHTPSVSRMTRCSWWNRAGGGWWCLLDWRTRERTPTELPSTSPPPPTFCSPAS